MGINTLRLLLRINSSLLVTIWTCASLFICAWTTANAASHDWRDMAVGLILGTAWLAITGRELRDSLSIVFAKKEPRNRPGKTDNPHGTTVHVNEDGFLFVRDKP